MINVRELPGPDTKSKAEATATDDRRLQLMLDTARQVGWPAAWTDDLYRHDREKLLTHPGESFLWILRDTGTHLYPIQCFNRHEASGRADTVRWWSGHHKLNLIDDPTERARYYIVSSAGLRRITWEQAVDCFSYSQ